VGVFVRRRQGTPVLVGFVITPCSSPHLSHNALCDKHAQQLGRLMRDGATLQDAVTMMRATDMGIYMPAVAAPDLELVREPMALDLQESEILSDAADTSVERDVVMKDDAKAKEDRRNAAAERILLSSGGTRRVCTRALLDHYATMDNNIRMIKISNEHGQPLRLIAYTHPRKDNSTAGIKTLQNRAKDMSVKRSLMSSLTGATDDIKNKNNIKLIQTEMKQSIC
jgi:hypothetical protein